MQTPLTPLTPLATPAAPAPINPVTSITPTLDIKKQVCDHWADNKIIVRQTSIDFTTNAFEHYLQPPKTPSDWLNGTSTHIDLLKKGIVWATPEMTETSNALHVMKQFNVGAIRFSLNNIPKISMEYINPDDKNTITCGPFNSIEEIFDHCQSLGITKILNYNMTVENIAKIACDLKHPCPYLVKGYSVGDQNKQNASIELTVQNLPAPKSKRQRLQLILLLDCSGSMCGDKIVNMKKSLIEMALVASSVGSNCDNSNNPVISFQLVPFDDKLLYNEFPLTKEKYVSSMSKFMDNFKDCVNSLTPMGSTNFTTPIKESTKFINSNMENHVILFTDGYANSGLSKPDELRHFISKTFEKTTNFHIFGIGDSYNSNVCLSMIDGHKVPSDSIFHLTGNESTIELPSNFLKRVISSFARYLEINLTPEATLKSKSNIISWPKPNETFSNILFEKTNETKYAEICQVNYNNSKFEYMIELPEPTPDDKLVDLEFKMLKISDIDENQPIDEKSIKDLAQNQANLVVDTQNCKRMAKLQKTLQVCNLSMGNQRTVNLYNLSTNSSTDAN